MEWSGQASLSRWRIKGGNQQEYEDRRPRQGEGPDLPFLRSDEAYMDGLDDTIQPSHPLSSPSPPAFSLSQHQALFQWVSSSHQVAKELELLLQHQSFQWIFRTDLLQNWLVWSGWREEGKGKGARQFRLTTGADHIGLCRSGNPRVAELRVDCSRYGILGKRLLQSSRWEITVVDAVPRWCQVIWFWIYF